MYVKAAGSVVVASSIIGRPACRDVGYGDPVVSPQEVPRKLAYDLQAAQFGNIGGVFGIPQMRFENRRSDGSVGDSGVQGCLTAPQRTVLNQESMCLAGQKCPREWTLSHFCPLGSIPSIAIFLLSRNFLHLKTG
jgi:hypothetical protein